MLQNLFENKLFIAALYLLCAVFINNIIIGSAVKFIKKRLLSVESHYGTILNVIKTLFCAVIYFVTVILIINLLFNVDMSSVLAATGVLGVIVGFGAQSIVRDMINGFFILAEDQYKVGDLVEINNFTGTVRDLTFRITKIESFSGDIMIIPNGNITSITNLSKTSKNIFIDVPVSYEHDFEDICKILNTVLEKTDSSITAPGQILGVSALNESSYNVRIQLSCIPGEQYDTERRFLEYIRNEFKENGINHAVYHIRKDEKNETPRRI